MSRLNTLFLFFNIHSVVSNQQMTNIFHKHSLVKHTSPKPMVVLRTIFIMVINQKASFWFNKFVFIKIGQKFDGKDKKMISQFLSDCKRLLLKCGQAVLRW